MNFEGLHILGTVAKKVEMEVRDYCNPMEATILAETILPLVWREDGAPGDRPLRPRSTSFFSASPLLSVYIV